MINTLYTVDGVFHRMNALTGGPGLPISPIGPGGPVSLCMEDYFN